MGFNGVRRSALAWVNNVAEISRPHLGFHMLCQLQSNSSTKFRVICPVTNGDLGALRECGRRMQKTSCWKMRRFLGAIFILPCIKNMRGMPGRRPAFFSCKVILKEEGKVGAPLLPLWSLGVALLCRLTVSPSRTGCFACSLCLEEDAQVKHLKRWIWERMMKI